MAKRSLAEQVEEEGPSLHPKFSEHLIGHDAPEKQLLAMINAKRLPHALLLTGPRGIGKAALAYRLARFLLAPEDTGGGLFGEALPPESLYQSPTHTVFRRIVAGAHPDILVLESETIKIEEARTVGQFLSLTPAESAWRVVIIDSADALNRNAANALLKILEEPPAQAILLLVSHNPGNLLPTIRSRCRVLRVQPLVEADFARVMGQIAPEMPAADYAVWSLLSGGSPGVALSLMQSNADVLYHETLSLIASPDTLKLHGFAERFARKDAEKQGQVLSRLLLWLIARVTVHAADTGAEVFPGEREMLMRLFRAKTFDSWTELWEKAGKLLADTDNLYLDRKQTILSLLRAIGE